MRTILDLETAMSDARLGEQFNISFLRRDLLGLGIIGLLNGEIEFTIDNLPSEYSCLHDKSKYPSIDLVRTIPLSRLKTMHTQTPWIPVETGLTTADAIRLIDGSRYSVEFKPIGSSAEGKVMNCRFHYVGPQAEIGIVGLGEMLSKYLKSPDNLQYAVRDRQGAPGSCFI